MSEGEINVLLEGHKKYEGESIFEYDKERMKKIMCGVKKTSCRPDGMPSGFFKESWGKLCEVWCDLVMCAAMNPGDFDDDFIVEACFDPKERGGTWCC